MARKRDKKSRSPEDYGIRTVSCGGGSGFRSTSHPRRKSSQRKRAYPPVCRSQAGGQALFLGELRITYAALRAVRVHGQSVWNRAGSVAAGYYYGDHNDPIGNVKLLQLLFASFSALMMSH